MKNKAKRTIFHRIIDWLLNLILIACGGIIVWLLLIITTFSSFKVPTGSMEPTILPGDTFEIRQGVNRVRNFEGTIGNLERQQMLPHTFMPNKDWKEKGIFPSDTLMNWSLLEFGPLYIPAKGDEIAMNRKHHSLYMHLIEWEQKKKLTLKGDSILLDDSLIHTYCFQENYYFMAGDRVTSSRDSRYWGLLPEPYIVGVATLIWKSVDKETGKIRWDRVIKTLSSNQ